MLQNQLAQLARRSLQIVPAALLVVGLATQPACAQENLARVLSVTGRGSEAAPTSATRVSLGVQVDGATAEDAQSEAAQRSTRIVEKLQSEQVDKLETAGITLNPRYDYSDNRRRLVGYTATNTVSFEVDTGRAGELLDELVQTGATDINGVSFIASDEAIATAQQQALAERRFKTRRRRRPQFYRRSGSPHRRSSVSRSTAPIRPHPFHFPWRELSPSLPMMRLRPLWVKSRR